jgi:hypothetical protein
MPAVESLKKLDASDATEGQPTYDGRFSGVDLTVIAARFSRRPQGQNSGIPRLFAAAVGLQAYAKAASPETRLPAATILIQGLLEGAVATMSGRQPDLNAIPGFRGHFIDAELRHEIATIKNDVQGHYAVNGWRTYWEQLLGNCRTDLFVNTEACPF